MKDTSRLSIEYVPAGQLHTFPGNPREGDVGAIAGSMEDLGVFKGVVAQRSTGYVLAGNHAYQAMVARGMTEIPVTWRDVDDVTAKAIVARDNHTSDQGTYNLPALAELLTSLPDVTLAGYDGDDLDDIIGRLGEAGGMGRSTSVLTDPDYVPPTPRDPFTRDGDVWQLGRHRVVCGSAEDPAAYEAALDGRKADMVWTDPPYGVAVASRIGTNHMSSSQARALGHGGIDNDELDVHQLTEFLRVTLTATLAATKKGALWYVTAPHGPIGLAFSIVLHELDVWRHSLVWVKQGLVLGRADYHYRHEPIYYGWTPGAARLHPVPDRKQDTVHLFDKPSRSADHPTMKPVPMVAHHLQMSSHPGALVLDPFAGSGTVVIACHMEGRDAAVIEKAPKYVDVICRRYQEATGELPVRVGDGVAHDFVADAGEAAPQVSDNPPPRRAKGKALAGA